LLALADIDLAWLNDALGQAYDAVGDLDVAQAKFAEAHRLISAAVTAKRAPATDLASILNDMSSVSLRRNDMTTARASLCESVALSIETRGATHRNTLIARPNLVGLSRQMGLIGAARKQLDLAKADLESLRPTDPVRAAIFLHTARLAITIGSFQDAVAGLTEAEKFYEGLGDKGQGYTEQIARIAELRQVALLGLGEPDKAMESGEASQELYRRSFGRLSAPELNVRYWMTRTAVALHKPDLAEALHAGPEAADAAARRRRVRKHRASAYSWRTLRPSDRSRYPWRGLLRCTAQHTTAPRMSTPRGLRGRGP
jgi:tetratricopeptide (TPR) repeat protein